MPPDNLRMKVGHQFADEVWRPVSEKGAQNVETNWDTFVKASPKSQRDLIIQAPLEQEVVRCVSNRGFDQFGIVRRIVRNLAQVSAVYSIQD